MTRTFASGAIVLLMLTSVVQADGQIRRLQDELRQRNLYFGDLNGEYTGATAAAVREYQKRKGFTGGGYLDEQTLVSLGLAPETDSGEPALRSELGLTRSEREARYAAQARAASGEGSETDSAYSIRAGAHTESGGGEPESIAEFIDEAPPATRRLPERRQGSVRQFVSDYLADVGANNPARELRHYGERVDYYDRGIVNKSVIYQNARRHKKVWPKRDYRLLEVESYGSKRDRSMLAVKFVTAYSLSGSRGGKVAMGRTLNVLTVKVEGSQMKIVGIQEERLRPEVSSERPPFTCRFFQSFSRLFGCR